MPNPFLREVRQREINAPITKTKDIVEDERHCTKPTSRKTRTEKPFVVRVVAVLRHNACYDMRENLVGFKTDVYRGLKVKELRTIV